MSTPNDKFFFFFFFEILFYGKFYLLLEEIAEDIYFFSYSVLMSDLGFTSNKPTQYLLGYGDF